MYRGILIVSLLLLGGCSTVVDVATKTAEVWMDPSIPVGEPEDIPTTLTLSMNASAQVNPNVYNDNALAATGPEEEYLTEEQANEELDDAEFLASIYRDVTSGSMPDSAEIKPVEEILQIPGLDGIGGPDEQVEMEASASSEPPPEPEATPIAFKFIQLKDNSLFLQADFEGLFNDMENALGTTYLKHDDYMLLPSEFKFIEPFGLEEDTRYVAVIAAYNDYANKEWKAIEKIKSKGKQYSLLLHFDDKQVSMKKQEL